MNRLGDRSDLASLLALALLLAGCGANSSKRDSAGEPQAAPAALAATSKVFLASVGRKDATAVCSYFTSRGRAHIVKDAHSSVNCFQVLAAEFKRGASFLSFTPATSVQITRVQTYGRTVLLSYRPASGHGDTIPWVKTRSGWKIDRTG
jgi:hypothetical protein